MSKVVELVYSGEEEYHSTDPWNDDKSVDAYAGDAIEVSEEKAAQLLRDFPDWFAPVKAGETAKQRKEREKAEAARREQEAAEAAKAGAPDEDAFDVENADDEALLAKAAELEIEVEGELDDEKRAGIRALITEKLAAAPA